MAGLDVVESCGLVMKDWRTFFKQVEELIEERRARKGWLMALEDCVARLPAPPGNATSDIRGWLKSEIRRLSEKVAGST
jgi:hypothetical protein